MRVARLLIAVSQPLLRVRLHALGSQASLAVVAEAVTAEQAADMALALNPDLILCDELIMNDSALERFLVQRTADNASRFVLISSGTAVPSPASEVPLAGTIPMSILPTAMREQLLRIYDSPMNGSSTSRHGGSIPRAVAGLEHRFVIAGEDDRNQNMAPWREQRSAEVDDAVPATPELEPPGHATGGGGIAGRRRRSKRRDRLESLLAEAKTEIRKHGERDSITGLPTAKVMDRALQALTEAGCPSAIVVVQICRASDGGEDPGAINSALRSTSGALQANVRRGDVVCLLDDMTFAVIMPGLDREASVQPIDRISAAVEGILRNHRIYDHDIFAATGSGYWTPPMSPTEPVEQAWRNMLASRQANESRTIRP